VASAPLKPNLPKVGAKKGTSLLGALLEISANNSGLTLKKSPSIQKASLLNRISSQNKKK